MAQLKIPAGQILKGDSDSVTMAPASGADTRTNRGLRPMPVAGRMNYYRCLLASLVTG